MRKLFVSWAIKKETTDYLSNFPMKNEKNKGVLVLCTYCIDIYHTRPCDEISVPAFKKHVIQNTEVEPARSPEHVNPHRVQRKSECWFKIFSLPQHLGWEEFRWIFSPLFPLLPIFLLREFWCRAATQTFGACFAGTKTGAKHFRGRNTSWTSHLRMQPHDAEQKRGGSIRQKRLKQWKRAVILRQCKRD